MLASKNPYNTEIPTMSEWQKISEAEITRQLQKYLEIYKDCFVRSQQIKYFETFEKGLLSNLDRKSIEPIALSFLGEKAVRGMQQFFTRSTGWEERVRDCYKENLSQQISGKNGFLSVDESDFAKKRGKCSRSGTSILRKIGEKRELSGRCVYQLRNRKGYRNSRFQTISAKGLVR